MQKVHDMNIATEPKLSGKPMTDKPHKRPVRLVRWFLIVGVVLGVIVGGLAFFKFVFLPNLFKEIFSKPPPPTNVNVATAKSETIPNLLTAVGDLAAVHQVNVTSDVNGRITDIMFTAGASVKQGTPLLQLFDGPDQGDLANYKAQQKVAQISLDRAKQLAERQFGPQATVDNAQAAFDQASAGIAKTESIISQKMVRAPFNGELGVRKVEVGQYLTAGTQIVSLTDLSALYANFTVTEKDSGAAEGRAVVRIGGRCRSGPDLRGPDHHHRTADRDRYPQHSRAGDLAESGQDPQARHVRDHHRGPAGQAARLSVPKTAVDYTLYGDSVYLLSEKKVDDGKTSLVVTRTFVQAGNRVKRARRNPQGAEGGRPRGGRWPAQAAIGMVGDDLGGSGAADSGQATTLLRRDAGHPDRADKMRAAVFETAPGRMLNSAG